MDAQLKIHCNSCQQPTRHNVLREYVATTEEGGSEGWHIVQCNGCDAISFYLMRVNLDESGIKFNESFAYPARLYRTRKYFENAPDRLELIYREMIDAFNEDSYLLCAGGLRVLVEGICANEGVIDGPIFDQQSGDYIRNEEGDIVRSSNLVGKIEGLAEKQILTPRQARTLHEHRYLGNKALHELDVPDSNTLTIAIEIVEHVMDDLYKIPYQADGLKRLRQDM